MFPSPRSLTALSLSALLTVGLAAPAAASTYDAELDSATEQTTVTAAGDRDVRATPQGLQLDTVLGDTVVIEGTTAIWKDAFGSEVATIKLTVSDSNVTFVYDELTSTIRAISAHNSAMHRARAKKCIPKWINFGFQILWNGAVCAPIGLATGGIGAFACTTASGAVFTALGC